MNGKTISEQLYLKYEYLAKKYVSQICSYECLAFTREDLEQEFKIKIFTSIRSYGKRWGAYRRGEAKKPVALRYYLETACANKRKDFMKYIERENIKTSIDEIDYDFGVEDRSYISPETNEFIIRDINVLEHLTGMERTVFSMFVRGYDMRTLTRIISNKVNNNRSEAKSLVNMIIENQRQYLISRYGNELTRQTTMYSSYSIDD